MELARSERDFQSLKIQQDIQEDKMEAIYATKIAGTYIICCPVYYRVSVKSFTGKSRV